MTKKSVPAKVKSPKSDTIPLASIKLNPNNPRTITEESFRKLVKSIHDFPKMLSLRPMVVNSKMEVLGGNMRLRALQTLGYVDIPTSWVRTDVDLTPDEVRRFVAVDNLSFGEWDYDMLASQYTIEELTEIGFDQKKLLDEWPIGEEPSDEGGPGDMECQPREHWDYVVFMFETREDWLQVCQRLELKQVHTSEHSEHKIGLGRVLKGQRLLALLAGEK